MAQRHLGRSVVLATSRAKLTVALSVGRMVGRAPRRTHTPAVPALHHRRCRHKPAQVLRMALCPSSVRPHVHRQPSSMLIIVRVATSPSSLGPSQSTCRTYLSSKTERQTTSRRQKVGKIFPARVCTAHLSRPASTINLISSLAFALLLCSAILLGEKLAIQVIAQSVSEILLHDASTALTYRARLP